MSRFPLNKEIWSQLCLLLYYLYKDDALTIQSREHLIQVNEHCSKEYAFNGRKVIYVFTSLESNIISHDAIIYNNRNYFQSNIKLPCEEKTCFDNSIYIYIYIAPILFYYYMNLDHVKTSVIPYYVITLKTNKCVWRKAIENNAILS